MRPPRLLLLAGGLLTGLLLAPTPALADPACPTCDQPVEEEWRYCPFDGTLVDRSCPECGEEMEPGWQYCPDDGTPLRPPGESPDRPFFRPGAEGQGERPADSGTEGPGEEDTGPTSRNTPMQVIDAFLTAVLAESPEDAADAVDWPRVFSGALEDLEGEARTERLEELVDRTMARLHESYSQARARSYRVDEVTVGADEATIHVIMPPAEVGQVQVTQTFRLALGEEGTWRIVSLG